MFFLARSPLIIRECRATLSGTFNSAFLDQAESKEEEDFYVAVSTFFLQKRQQENAGVSWPDEVMRRLISADAWAGWQD